MKNLRNLLIFLVVLALAAGACIGPVLLLSRSGIPVAFPHVQLPPEALTERPILGIPGFYLTNTLLSLLIADLVVLVLALIAGSAARRRLKLYEANPKAVDAEGDDLMVPKGWHNTFEALVEFIYNLANQVVGSEWGPKVFPIAGTIFLLVLTANWLHFIPLVDSVGIMHCAEPSKGVAGYIPVEIGHTGIYRLGFEEDNRIFPSGQPSVTCPAHGAEGEAAHGAEGGGQPIDESGIRVTVTPFLRTAATDLNMTLGLALVAMVSVQAFGVMKLGPSYFFRFFNLPALSKGFVGVIELAVSVLEAISESIKVVSLSLRLFGNIFAGAVLLMVISFLIPVGAPLIFYLLEVLIGALQAFVFAMLTLVFSSVAMAGHGDHAEEHH